MRFIQPVLSVFIFGVNLTMEKLITQKKNNNTTKNKLAGSCARGADNLSRYLPLCPCIGVNLTAMAVTSDAPGPPVEVEADRTELIPKLTVPEAKSKMHWQLGPWAAMS